MGFSLAACGGGGGSGGGVVTPPPVTPPGPTFPTGVDAGGSGSAGDAFNSNFGTTPTFQPTAHQGLEQGFTIGFGHAIDASPTLTFTRTTTGFDETLPGGGTARYDTRPGSRDITGQNQYTTCAANCGTTSATTVTTRFTNGTGSDLTASTYGTRRIQAPSGQNQYLTAFALGSPTSAIPTTGTATYTGGASGYSFHPINNNVVRTFALTGNVSLTADFAARSINGAITNITSEAIDFVDANPPAYSIALTGGTFTGSSFTGTASTTLFGSGTGQFGGTFNGDSAGEVGGTFAVTEGSVTGRNIIGSFGAKRLGTGAASSGTGTPTGPLAGFNNQTTFTPTAHRGLEIVRRSGGLTPLAAPTATFTRTSTGFNLALSQGTVSYDTRAGSSHITGTNRFDSCIDSCATGTPTRVVTTFNGGNALSLAYSTYGTWAVATQAGISDFGVFATGLATTSLQQPTTGSATFTGNASGYIATGATSTESAFSGDAVLTANFAARTIGGSVSSITTQGVATPTNTGVLGDIQFATTSFSGTTFNGTATPTVVANAAVDLTGATGQYSGAFYGPTATEAAGSFTLANSNVTVIGGFAARTPPLGINSGTPGGPPRDPISALTARLSYTAIPNQGLVAADYFGNLRTIGSTNLTRTSTGFTLAGRNFDTRNGDNGYSQSDFCFGQGCNFYDVDFERGAREGLSYSTYGVWSTRQIFGTTDFAAFATGIPTLPGRMPTSGSASYAGGAAGYVTVGGAANSNDVSFKGDATINANFASNSVSGAITSITTRGIEAPNATGTMNNIRFSPGSITGAGFTGVATVDPATAPTVNISGATGNFGGVFYGPSAQEVAGSFALTNPGMAVIGSFGAKR